MVTVKTRYFYLWSLNILDIFNNKFHSFSDLMGVGFFSCFYFVLFYFLTSFSCVEGLEDIRSIRDLFWLYAPSFLLILAVLLPFMENRVVFFFFFLRSQYKVHAVFESLFLMFTFSLKEYAAYSPKDIGHRKCHHNKYMPKYICSIFLRHSPVIFISSSDSFCLCLLIYT